MFVNKHINDQLFKNIERLRVETGTLWRISGGGGKIYYKYCTASELLLM